MLDIYPNFTRLLDTNDNDTLGFFSPLITSSSPIIHRPRRTQGINLERIYRSVKAAPFPEQSPLGHLAMVIFVPLAQVWTSQCWGLDP